VTDQRISGVFEYGEFRVAVSSDDASHLSWLEEFLAPSFLVGRRGVARDFPADCTIALTSDQERYERLCAGGPSGEMADAYALDRKIMQLPTWNSEGASRVAWDEESNVFHIVDATAHHIQIVAPDHKPISDTGCTVRIAFMRAVREVTMLHTRGVGSLMHAAAFALGDAGVLAAGPKRAGKTTLLTYALTAAGAALVANDRVLVRPSGEEAVVRGMPTILTLREGTLEFFPEIRTRLTEAGLHIGATLQEAKRKASSGSPFAVGPSGEGHFAVTGAQLCEAAGTTQIAEARLAGILFPRVGDSRGALTLHRLEPDDAFGELTRSVFGSDRRPATRALFDLADESGRQGTHEASSMCRTLASTVPCFSCDVGPDSYRMDDSAEALVQQFRS
jgi:hypothetical protein